MDLEEAKVKAGWVLVRERVGFVVDSVLRGYSQIFFSRSRLVGVLLLIATALSPHLMLAGLAAVIVAVAIARLIHLSPDLIRAGLFGYNGLLVGLGGAAMLVPGWTTLGVLVIGVALSVLVTAALHSALGTHSDLPALTLPFLLVLYAVLGAVPALGIEWNLPVGFALQNSHTGFLALVEGYFEALGAIFFEPRFETGLLVCLALLAYSRIAFVFSLVGYVVAAFVAAQVVVATDPTNTMVLHFNGILAAIALGGVWFVPSLSSLLFAAGGALVAALVMLGLLPVLEILRIPPLILPFNLTAILLLYAMRQRMRDTRPKAVDFLLGAPEENLVYFRTRVARFGARYALRFRSPFLGRWVCTQGSNGELTHRGPWRHALDFEVKGTDNKHHSGKGTKLSDYHCYKLPVVAASDGTVAKVVDGVPDNPIGEQNLQQNWGNLVILYHAPWLYSLVCHLSPGSIKVREGEIVRSGQVLGLCGSSGRSPVPHLHFQLQATARVGATTLPVELHNVVTREGAQRLRLHGTLVPERGQEVRHLNPQPDMASLLELRLGEPLLLKSEGSNPMVRTERLEPDIDPMGRLVLRSADRGATLYYEHNADLFTVFDTVGSRRSYLHLVQMALGRVPFELDENLEWTDFLPVRRLLPTGLAPLYDLLSPFVPTFGLEVTYRSHRRGEELIVEGRSVRVKRDGSPWLTTRATLRNGSGIGQIEVCIGQRRHVVVRAVPKDDKSDDGAKGLARTTNRGVSS